MGSGNNFYSLRSQLTISSHSFVLTPSGLSWWWKPHFPTPFHYHFPSTHALDKRSKFEDFKTKGNLVIRRCRMLTIFFLQTHLGVRSSYTKNGHHITFLYPLAWGIISRKMLEGRRKRLFPSHYTCNWLMSLSLLDNVLVCTFQRHEGHEGTPDFLGKSAAPRAEWRIIQASSF